MSSRPPPRSDPLDPFLGRLQEIQQVSDTDARLRGLGNLARKIFVDRNAAGMLEYGMPKGDRLAIKAAARPFLRHAIHWLRKSRDTLLADDIERHEFMRDRARMYRAFARLEFFQPYANELGKRYVSYASQGAKGGRESAKRFKPRTSLEGLIRAAFHDKRPMRVEAWVEEGMGSRSTIYRVIRKIETERKAKN